MMSQPKILQAVCALFSVRDAGRGRGVAGGSGAEGNLTGRHEWAADACHEVGVGLSLRKRWGLERGSIT
jgi:hypothetical protein